MNKASCIVFFMVFKFHLFAQTDTFRVFKPVKQVYKCTNQEALTWYLYVRNDKIFLADIKIPTNEVIEWFARFSNSQNLYQASRLTITNNFLVFMKPNDESDRIGFIIQSIDDFEINLKIDNELFNFKII